MNILHITDIGDNKYSGVQVVVPELILNQQKKAHVAVLNLNAWKLPGVDTQFQYLNEKTLQQVIDEFGKPDLAIFHEVYKPKYLVIYKQLKKQGIPYVIVPHVSLTRIAQQKKHIKKVLANILVFNKFISSAIAIQCLSQNEYDNTDFKVNKYICPNGIYLPRKKKENFNTNSIKIAFIGRIDIYHKGLDILLQAISRAKEELIDANALIDIYGPESSDLKCIKDMINDFGLSELVSYNGVVIGDQKRTVILDADLLIQTSRMEGMPMGILEAWSYGLPTLITDGTAMADMCNKYDCGWVSKTDANSVAEALRLVINERRLLCAKSLNAKKCVEENFTWDVVTDVSLNMYDKIIGSQHEN